MLENLKSLIVSELKVFKKEKYENNDKNLEEEILVVLEEANKVKYNYHGKNKLKIFFYDILNHGMFEYHSSFILNFIGLLFISISLLFGIFIIGYQTISQNQTIGIYILSGILILGFSSCIALTSLFFTQLYLELPDRTYGYRKIEEIENKIHSNHMEWEKSLTDNDKLFDENNKYFECYKQITISKELLSEVIKSLSENNVKELLDLGNGKQIYYGHLIERIKRIEREKELSEVYNQIKNIEGV